MNGNVNNATHSRGPTVKLCYIWSLTIIPGDSAAAFRILSDIVIEQDS